MADAATAIRSRLLIRGMGGMGDCIKQRALVRYWMRTHQVWLETPWPLVYHDLVGAGLKLVPLKTSLRTQAKSVQQCQAMYHAAVAPSIAETKRVWYTPADMRATTMMQAMLKATATPPDSDDFRMPVAAAWDLQMDRILTHKINQLPPAKRDLPLLVLRPLVKRTEWSGCDARNPDAAAFRNLFDAIRRDYIVVSLADLQPNAEWLVDKPMGADIEFHRGELTLDLMAALFRRAALVYCSPGFALHLAAAVETSVACVFGGYERARMHADSAAWAPYLGIDTITPCDCFSHHHACEKRINMPEARQRLKEFSDGAVRSRIKVARSATA